MVPLNLHAYMYSVTEFFIIGERFVVITRQLEAAEVLRIAKASLHNIKGAYTLKTGHI
jgi:hypothetical protein